MKKIMMLFAAALCLGAPALKAGWLYDGTVTVAAGATNASDTAVIRGGESATNCVSAIDRVEAFNASGPGTGTVSFAVASLSGSPTVISASAALPPGSAHADSPKRAYAAVAGGVTNAAADPYYARYVTVSVAQAATNSAPTAYRWRIGAR